MIKTYEQAKKLIPGLQLETTDNSGAVFYCKLELFRSTSIDGTGWQSQVEVFLNGMIAGVTIEKA